MMKISVMQPYFFPYLGYFSLIKESDVFVVLDNVQYIRRGWMNRNRILGNNKPEYIHVSTIKMPQKTKITEICINHHREWKNILLNKLQRYEGKAPYYHETYGMVDKLLDFETKSLSELNVYILKQICERLGINTEFYLASELNINEDNIKDSDDWGLEIARKFNCHEYINLIGGKSLYNKDKYLANDVDLKFISNQLNEYSQKSEMFVESLSIIDVLMFNSIDETMNLINEITVQ